MSSSRHLSSFAIVCILLLLAPGSARSQESANFTGRWVLNRSQSQTDKEVGFNPAALTAATRAAEREANGEGGGRGGRGGGGSGGGEPGRYAVRESQEDAQRLQQFTAEARTPSPHLTIVDSGGMVTVADADDVSRTLHTDGKDDYLQVRGLPVTAVTLRDSGRLVVRYKVEQGRELRYSYAREAAKLTVDIQFVEDRRVVDSVRRVYDLIGPSVPFPPTDVAPKTAPAPAGTAPALPPPGGLRGAAPAVPADAPPEPFNQQPDAELKGLTRLGVVVEGLGPQASSCGLTQSALESLVIGKLKTAGFTVVTNTDEDSYVYVNVNTGSLSTGSCVSRFDVSINTHTTARLSYQRQQMVLVEVSLMRKGGLSASAAAGHGAAVVKGVSDDLDEFIARIKAANK